MMGPGMYMPGQTPFQQQHPQEPPCLKDFAPLKAEAEKRGLALKKAMEAKTKPSREEACNMFKGYSSAEAKVVKFIVPFAGAILLLQGIVEIVRCVICIRDGQWPSRVEDVEEVDVDKLKEMVHVKDEDIFALDKYVAVPKEPR